MSEFKLPTHALPAKFRPFLFKCALIDRGLRQRVVEMLDAPIYQMAASTRGNAARDLLGEIYALREKQGMHGRLANPKYGNEVIESTKAVYEWLRLLANVADAAAPDKDAANDLTEVDEEDDEDAAMASAKEKTAAEAAKLREAPVTAPVTYELRPSGTTPIDLVWHSMVGMFNLLTDGRITQELVDRLPPDHRALFFPCTTPPAAKPVYKKVGRARPVAGHPDIKVALVSGHFVFSKSLDEEDDTAIDMLHWTGNEIRAISNYLNEDV